MSPNKKGSELPDVIGYELKEAVNILDSFGYIEPEIKVTKPIFATETLGEPRVVRLKTVEGDHLQVVVAYKDYLKGGA